MLVETLAQYSALMVMEKTYGPDQIRKFLKTELDTYLRSRGAERIEEEPLDRVENQQYIHYSKGSPGHVPVEGPDRRGCGEPRVAQAFGAVPIPEVRPSMRPRMLVALFRAEAPADKQQLIYRSVRQDYDFRLQGKWPRREEARRRQVCRALDRDHKRKSMPTARDEETPAKLGDNGVDIGLFTAEPGKKDFESAQERAAVPEDGA